MGSLVEYLRERGYVELQPDPQDGRAKRVLLTERGCALQQTALEISEQAERELSGLLGEGKVEQLRGLLEELNDTLPP
jgi:DNA-binding MarR family transcriptional regulator